MIIVGIMAAVAMPRMSLLGGFDEIGYRDSVKSTLEFARKSAVAQRRYVCVLRTGNNLDTSIDTSTPETRQAFSGTALTCPRQQPLALAGSNDTGIAPHGTTTLLNTSDDSVVFDALGRPWTASSNAVSSTATFTVHGDSDLLITVEAETGYVH